MKTIALLMSLLFSIAYGNVVNGDPCIKYKNLLRECSTCSTNKTCDATHRVYCAQLSNYNKQCYYYEQGLQAAKQPANNSSTTQNNKGNKLNTPSTTLQNSFDTETPDNLQNKLHLYKNDITSSNQMPEVVAPKPTMPKETPTKAPSANDNILKAWY